MRTRCWPHAVISFVAYRTPEILMGVGVLILVVSLYLGADIVGPVQ